MEEAYNGLERLEHVCQILLSAERLGGARPMPLEELGALREIRRTLGPRIL